MAQSFPRKGDWQVLFLCGGMVREVSAKPFVASKTKSYHSFHLFLREISAKLFPPDKLCQIHRTNNSLSHQTTPYKITGTNQLCTNKPFQQKQKGRKQKKQSCKTNSAQIKPHKDHSEKETLKKYPCTNPPVPYQTDKQFGKGDSAREKEKKSTSAKEICKGECWKNADMDKKNHIFRDCCAKIAFFPMFTRYVLYITKEIHVLFVPTYLAQNSLHRVFFRKGFSSKNVLYKYSTIKR